MPGKTAERNSTDISLFSKHNRKTLLLLLIAVSATFVASLLLPFLVERQGEEWENWRRASVIKRGPLGSKERLYQMNTDIPAIIERTSHFPGIFLKSGYMASRPLYPAAGAALCRILAAVRYFPDMALALQTPCGWRGTVLSLLAVNYLMVCVAVLAFWAVMRRHFDARVALMSALLLATSSFIFVESQQATTDVIAVWVLAVALYVFDDMLSPVLPSWKYVLGGSLVLGLLMLGKPNYDVLIIGWLAMICLGRWQIAVGSVVLHAIPRLVWALILKLMGSPFVSQVFASFVVSASGGGGYLFKQFIHYELRDMYWALATHTGTFVSSVLAAFSPFLLLLAIVALLSRHSLQRRYKWFVGLSVFAVWGFLFAIRRPVPYLAFDLFIVVYPLAALGFYRMLPRILAYLSRWIRISERGAAGVFVIVNALLSWYLNLSPSLEWTLSLGH